MFFRRAVSPVAISHVPLRCRSRFGALPNKNLPYRPPSRPAVKGVTESDTEILDRLFTMFDKTGDDQVNFREFVVGISPLITGDVVSKLNFSFELYDLDGTGQIRPNEMSFILSSMNATASYFGDPVMTSDQIESLVDDIFKTADSSGTGTLSYSEYMTAVAEHPVLVSFITGAGSVRYGSGK